MIWRRRRASKATAITGGHRLSRPTAKLFITTGERQKFTPAQDPRPRSARSCASTPDGSRPPATRLPAQGFDPRRSGAYGHRNLLGIAFDAQGRLWEQEMGPQGGDELNLIVAGRNYGYADRVERRSL